MTSDASELLRFEETYRRRILWLIVALSLLSLWALFRLDVIFDAWEKTDYVAYRSQIAEAQEPFMGYYALRECRFWESSCRPPTDEELGALKDPMLPTGYIAAFLGLWLTIRLEPQFLRLNRQLLRDQIVPWTIADLRRLDHIRHRLAWGVAAAVFLSITIGFIGFHYGWQFPTNNLDQEHFISAVIMGTLAGHRMGTAAAMGWLSRVVINRQAHIKLLLGHSDGMGGARSYGDFLAFQALLLAIPMIWLTGWIGVLYAQPVIFSIYQQWFWVFVALLAITIFVLQLAFSGPLQTFSRRYRIAKSEALSDWTEKTFADLAHARREAQSPDWKDAQEAMAQVEEITAVSESIDAMPDIPVRPGLRSSLPLTTVLPLLVLIAELLFGDLGLVADILDIFS